MKYISKSKWYSILLPQHWVVEEEEGCTTFFTEDGVGALQISAYDTGENQSAEKNMLEYLEGETENEVKIFVSKIHQQEIANCSYQKDDDFFKVWIVTKGKYLILITYVSDSSLNDKETEEVDDIAKSLEVTK